MFPLDDDREARAAPGDPSSGDNAPPPPSDADTLRLAERSRPLLTAYDPGVTPWYDGRRELPGR